MTPTLSVIMANYNNADYVSEAVSSVICQTFTEWELLIIDDASTDDSIEKVKSFNDQRIRLLVNERNIGYTSSLKRLIDAAVTDIVCILDSDDALASSALGSIHGAYLDNPECGFIYSNYMVCDHELNPLYAGISRAIPQGETNLICDCVSHFKTFRKSVYYKTSGYDERILYAEDKDISYKLEEVTRLFFVNQNLYRYRILPTSLSHDPIKAQVGEASFDLAKYYAYLRRKKTGFPSITRNQIIGILDKRIHILNHQGLLQKSRKILLSAFFLQPLKFDYLALFLKSIILR